MKLKTNAKINNDMRTLFLLTTLLFIIPNMFGQKEYRLNSPDGKLAVSYTHLDVYKRQSLNNVLEYISQAGGINYKIESDNTIIIY